MKTPLTYIKQLIAYAVPAILTLGATGLALFALTAESAKPNQPIGAACKKWPAQADKAKVEQAFTTILQNSATDQGLRDRLTDPRNCYASAKQAVQDELNKPPGKPVAIPREALIIFYEDDSSELKGLPKRRAEGPSDHCLHIFFLPPFQSPISPKTSFSENLMCCYKPW